MPWKQEPLTFPKERVKRTRQPRRSVPVLPKRIVPLPAVEHVEVGNCEDCGATLWSDEIVYHVPPVEMTPAKTVCWDCGVQYVPAGYCDLGRPIVLLGSDEIDVI